LWSSHASSTPGAARRGQLLVFDRFLARIAQVLGDRVMARSMCVAENRSASAHPAQGAMSWYSNSRRMGFPGAIAISAWRRSSACMPSSLLVDADDVLVTRRLIIDAQDIVVFIAEFFVLRREPHLLSMRLEIGILEDTTDAAIAQDDALLAHV
jgi:hypothetical protein